MPDTENINPRVLQVHPSRSLCFYDVVVVVIVIVVLVVVHFICQIGHVKEVMTSLLNTVIIF